VKAVNVKAHRTIVSASLLSADLSKLEKEIKKAESAGCEYIHFDVMDGVFVENISYGLPVLKAVSNISEAAMDVHLMIVNPLKYVKAFAESGADIITFHFEAASNIADTIAAIKSLGKKAGLAIKPRTPVQSILPYLEMLDMVLIMTVEPGFGGQSFIQDALTKISELSEMIREKGLSIPIQVDGGINGKTASKVIKAGASILVAGGYLYHADNMAKAVNSLLSCTGEAT